MEGFKEYILAVCITALIITLLQAVITDEAIKKYSSFAGGVALLIVMATPLVHLDPSQAVDIIQSHLQQADALEAQIENHEGLSSADLISERCTAYILERAESLGLSVRIDLEMSDDKYYPYPASVIITGSWDELQKNKLENILTNEIGIPSQRQEWKRR